MSQKVDYKKKLYTISNNEFIDFKISGVYY